MCSWVLINHKWPRLKKTQMWPFLIFFLFIYCIWFTKTNKKKSLWIFKVWLLDYISGLGARNLLYLPHFHAYIFAVAHYYGWVLLWFMSDPVLKAQFQKKKAHFNYFFPAIEEKHSPEFPTVSKGRPGWAVVRKCVVDVTWPYGCGFTAAFTCAVVKCSVLSLPPEPLGMKVSILLPVLFFSGPGFVSD